MGRGEDRFNHASGTTDNSTMPRFCGAAIRVANLTNLPFPPQSGTIEPTKKNSAALSPALSSTMPLRNLLVISLVFIFSMACYATATKNRYANLFAEAMDLVENKALYEVPRKTLFESAMNGMMGELDEHSMYISDDLFRSIDEDMNQQFGGVGMYVDTEPESKKLIVLAPIPDTPAFRAGIRAGDEIAEIAGKTTDGMDRKDAIKLMRGPQGTEVHVVFQRNGELFAKALVREVIPVPSVHGDWRAPNGDWQFTLQDMPNIGYIRLLQFGRKSSEEIREALAEIESSVDGVIIDLRNNTGGLLTAATEICDMFLDKGQTIVRTRGRRRKLVEELFAENRISFDSQIPIVILVNRHSASASEIVAGCLQDHGRAVIIGEQTWGKGTVQNMIPMQLNESALKLTVASFWRPSDRNIDRADPEAKRTKVWGIQPDEGWEVELTLDQVFQNIRNRNQRDIEGLRSGNSTSPGDAESEEKSEVKAEPKIDPPAPQPDETNDEDKPAPDDSNNGPQETVPAIDTSIDLPMEKAKEYFRTLFTKAAAA